MADNNTNDVAQSYTTNISGGDQQISPPPPVLPGALGPAGRDLAGQIINYQPQGPEHVNNLPASNDFERLGRLSSADAQAARRVWAYEPKTGD